MAQVSDQAGLSTDTYQAVRSATLPKTGLSVNQKKMMGITAATLLLGGGVGLVLAGRKPGVGTEVGGVPSAGEDNQNGTFLPPDIDAAGKVTDSMTFKQAFEAARDEVGLGGVFSWHGRWYNTFEKDEWSGLSLEQRQEYTEMLTGEKLPVVPYHTQAVSQLPAQTASSPEPTIIEGYLNGQRIMGLDVNHDGVIDALVMEGADGYTYRVVDTTGDDGLDMLYRYDPLNGELMEIEKIDEPFVLTNNHFSQGLEASMSKEVVDSILESDVPATTTAPVGETVDSPEDDSTHYIDDASEPDDTYINNGDVRDMDE